MSETWTIWCGYNVMKKAPNKGCKCNVCLLYRRVEELERQLEWLLNRVNINKHGSVSLPCGRITDDSFNSEESKRNIRAALEASEDE